MSKVKIRSGGAAIFALIAFVILPLHISYAQAVFPELSGPVVDNAEIIDAETEALLTKKLTALEAETSNQLVIATILSLEGRPLEEYANLLFRHWGLGQAEENNGVLLLVAKNDRKIRIEVGYGLEGTLTDAAAKTIIEAVILPSFRKQQFSTGISNGVEKIVGVLARGDAEVILDADKSTERNLLFDIFVFAVFFFVLLSGGLFNVLAMIFGKKLARDRYRWFGIEFDTSFSGGSNGSSGGYSGGGGSSGGGGASGSW